MHKSYIGQQLLLAVGQESFGVNGYEFTTLVPLMTTSGERVRPEDFPNRELAWFMLSGPLEVKRARPGRLLIGTIEKSQHFGTPQPEKDHFQVRIDSAAIAGYPNFIQILQPPGAVVLKPDAILDMAEVDLPCEPMAMVLVRIGTQLIGPFKTDYEEVKEGKWRVRFKKAAVDRPVNLFDGGAIPTQTVRADVSLHDSSPARSSGVHSCVYELALWSDFTTAQQSAKTLRLSTEEEAVSRIAKEILTRAKRQELIRDLKELGEVASRTGNASPEDYALLERVVAKAEGRTSSVDALINTIVESGRFESRIEQSVLKEVGRLIEERALEINASAQEKVAEVTRDLEAKRKELERVSDDINRRRRQADGELDQELSTKRARMEKELADLETMAELVREDIERQRHQVDTALEGVIERFNNGREAVLRDFLAIQPILERVGLKGLATSSSPETEAVQTSPHKPANEQPGQGQPMEDISLPDIWARDLSIGNPLDEVLFFDRFCSHVHDNGFRYDPADLLAFHLSVKCNNFVVLGGVSGAGKSSLPRLYVDAMAGDAGMEAARYLNVDVNPSWTNPADLLGYVNLIDRRFYPGSSGMFTFLARSAMEAERKRDDAGVYIACLDEMNLAQVEHYFTGFIQALSRSAVDRHVTVFDASSLAASDPLRRWSQLPLGDHMRFVGTVNFDETTRVLSQRILDRADLITLDGRDLMDLNGTASTTRVPATGPQLRYSDMRDWISERALSKKAVALLNELQAPLQVLGCPLTSRRHAGILRFVSSATPALFRNMQGDVEALALDMQIAQRIVPQIKGLFRRDAQLALDKLDGILNAQDSAFARTRRLIGRVREIDEDRDSLWMAD